MKVVRLYGPGDLRLRDEPLPVPAPAEILVHVRAVGVCGSDLHWFGQAGIGDARLDQPLVLGHEFAGVIADGPQQGEHVAVDPAVPCHACEFCRQGNPNLCTNLRFAGHGIVDGALREVIAWPTECLHPLPDSFSDADGVMLEPLGVALHAVDLGKLQVGMTVCVFGAGPIGLLILQFARLSGARMVIVTDKLSHRVDAARALGAVKAILAENESEVSEIMATTGGRGVDVAFEAAGERKT
jgi:L-iditol 2-dehydrogenase